MENRRKKLTIDSTVQWALVRRVLRHWAYFLILTAALLPFWVAVMTRNTAVPPFSIGELLLSGWLMTQPIILFFLVVAPLIAYDILKLSHRFVGPIYQLHKAIKALAAGEEIPPVRVREGDFWKDVIANFNALAEQVATMRKRETPSTSLKPETCGTPEAEIHWESALT